MTKFKLLLSAAAMAAAAISSNASATTYVCVDSVAVCSFDGTTGGIAPVKLAAGKTLTDKFKITFDAPGTAFLTLTSAKLTFNSASFAGINFTPIGGTDYMFDIAAAGTYDFILSVSNLTKITSTYSGTIDFVSAPVPEPTTWALMIGGFALAGVSLRRRKSAVSFA